MSQWLASKAYALGRWLDRRAAAQEAPRIPKVVIAVTEAPQSTRVVKTLVASPAQLHVATGVRSLTATSTFSSVHGLAPARVFSQPLLSASSPAAHSFHQWPAQGVRTASSVHQYP